MKYLIQFHNDTTQTAIVYRVFEPFLRNKSWLWFANQGDHMILYNAPWKEVYMLQPTEDKDTVK